MPPYIQGRSVIDIGCGSGILSLAAAAMGASQVFGYDIDSKAVAHSRSNLQLSHHADKITFSHEAPSISNPIFLMNMISSEQAEAWKPIPSLLITSGILTQDAPHYLAWRKSQGCKLLNSLQEDGWSGFVLKLDNKARSR